MPKPKPVKAPKETQLDLFAENKAKSPTTAAERADNRIAKATATKAKKDKERADKAEAKTESRTAGPTVEEDTSEIDLAANLAASKAQTETDQKRDVEDVEDTAAVNEKVNAGMQAAPTVEDIYTPNADSNI